MLDPQLTGPKICLSEVWIPLTNLESIFNFLLQKKSFSNLSTLKLVIKKDHYHEEAMILLKYLFWYSHARFGPIRSVWWGWAWKTMNSNQFRILLDQFILREDQEMINHYSRSYEWVLSLEINHHFPECWRSTKVSGLSE